MLAKEQKVDLPKKGIVLAATRGKTYVYYTVRAYRNAKGKPTSQRVSIGKYDDETGKLIPNRNYYEVYLHGTKLSMGTVKSCGTYHAVCEICKQNGLEKILQKHFPESWTYLLTIAHYMMCEGNVMYYLPDFQETRKSFCREEIDSEESSRIFASVDREAVQSFFRDWIRHRKNKEYIAYDVTSFSSYSKGMNNLEWGYNRDREKLPQINLAMYYGEESQLPLYYRVYPGSITDKTHLSYMVQDNEMLHCDTMRYVMDRGFYSENNLRTLTEKGCRFVIAMPSSLNLYRSLIEKNRDKIVNRSECRLGKGLPYAGCVECTEYGFRMKVHLYYDAAKAAFEAERFYDELDRQENELKEMTEPPDRKLHYDKYFFINRSKDGKMGYRRNAEAIDKEIAGMGFFAIAETDFTKSSAEILEIYRRRDVVEKSFDDLKNGLDMKRMHIQSEAVGEGKMFCAFLSLILRSCLQKHLRDFLREENLPFQKVLIELDKMQEYKGSQTSEPIPLNPPTKLQKLILDLISVPNV